MTDPTSGVMRQLPLSSLLLDWRNPRLPAAMQSVEASQNDLAIYINKHYDPVRIAESIAKHEFFQSEPLIAVEEENYFVVIEGNRRLTALKGLTDLQLRSVFAEENSAWGRIGSVHLPPTFPVLVVADAKSVAPLLGFRHISGIEPWDPYAQARYIARLVDDEGQSLTAVADLVGRQTTEVRSMYRDFDILEQAQTEFGIDTQRARASFGVFSNAMGRRGIQQFIGASAPRHVDPESYPLPVASKAPLAELLRWTFGNSRGEGRIILDSRQLGGLAKVLQSPDATQVLRDTGDLSDAVDALENVPEQYARAVAETLKALRKIRDLDSSGLGSADREKFKPVSDLVGIISTSLGND